MTLGQSIVKLLVKFVHVAIEQVYYLAILSIKKKKKNPLYLFIFGSSSLVAGLEFTIIQGSLIVRRGVVFHQYPFRLASLPNIVSIFHEMHLPFKGMKVFFFFFCCCCCCCWWWLQGAGFFYCCSCRKQIVLNFKMKKKYEV